MSEKYPSPAKEPAQSLWAPRPEQPEEKTMDRPQQTLAPLPAAPPRMMSATELIQAAVEKNLDPAALKELTAWAKDLRADEARRLFNEDMVPCQAAIPSIVNDSENTQTHSRYPKFETLLRTAKPIWTQFGFALSFGTADCPIPEHFRVICDVRHKAGHVERYQADIGIDGIGPKGQPNAMNMPQRSGSTFAYGQRYLVKLIFCLAFANEDDDAVNARNGKLGEKEIVQFNTKWDELRDAGWPDKNHAPFWKWLGVACLADLTLADYPKAIKELERQLAKLKGTAK